MAQLWGGRFTKQTDDAVKAFNDSLGFDRRLYRQDICGSMVHARMLGKQGIISARDCEEIDQGLKGILEDIEAGRLEFSTEYELSRRISSTGSATRASACTPAGAATTRLPWI